MRPQVVDVETWEGPSRVTIKSRGNLTQVTLCIQDSLQFSTLHKCPIFIVLFFFPPRKTMVTKREIDRYETFNPFLEVEIVINRHVLRVLRDSHWCGNAKFKLETIQIPPPLSSSPTLLTRLRAVIHMIWYVASFWYKRRTRHSSKICKREWSRTRRWKQWNPKPPIRQFP